MRNKRYYLHVQKKCSTNTKQTIFLQKIIKRLTFSFTLTELLTLKVPYFLLNTIMDLENHNYLLIIKRFHKIGLKYFSLLFHVSAASYLSCPV